jgi:glycosyltransferase involved in cell wall biosynthesis
MKFGISVVVPLFNPTAMEIERLLSGFSTQTDQIFQVIFVDDGSRNLKEIEDSLAHKTLYEKVLVKNLQNLGISQTLNFGIAKSKFRLVCIVDQDDFLEPHAIYTLKKCARKFPKQEWFFSNESIVYPDGSEIHTSKNHFNRVELESSMYINHIQMFNVELLGSDLTYNSEYDGSQDHELAIRLARKGYEAIKIEDTLYKWYRKPDSYSRAGQNEKQINPVCIAASLKALNKNGKDLYNSYYDNGIYTYRNLSSSKVSIVIPTGGKRVGINKKYLVEIFIESLQKSIVRGNFQDFEVIIVPSNSSDVPILQRKLRKYPFDFRIIALPGPFNFSRKINFGVELCSNNEVIFINDDIKILTPDCISLLIGFKEHYGLAVVGPLILDKHGIIQSAGDRVGMGNIAHIGTGLDTQSGLGKRISLLSREVSSITGAFFAVNKKLYKDMGGFSVELASSYQDVVFCAKLRERGFGLAIYPISRVKHVEGITRGKGVSPHERVIAHSLLGSTLEIEDPLGFQDYHFQVNYVNRFSFILKSVSKFIFLQMRAKIGRFFIDKSNLGRGWN